MFFFGYADFVHAVVLPFVTLNYGYSFSAAVPSFAITLALGMSILCRYWTRSLPCPTLAYGASLSAAVPCYVLALAQGAPGREFTKDKRISHFGRTLKNRAPKSCIL